MAVSLSGGYGEGEASAKKNAEKAIEKELGGIVADIAKDTTPEQDMYIDCLKIVEMLAMHN